MTRQQRQLLEAISESWDDGLQSDAIKACLIAYDIERQCNLANTAEIIKTDKIIGELKEEINRLKNGI